jgi:hypothetical protein
MVAFVDDEMSVDAYAIIDDALPDEALNEGNIYPTGWLVPTTADSSDCGRRLIEKRPSAGPASARRETTRQRLRLGSVHPEP